MEEVRVSAVFLIPLTNCNCNCWGFFFSAFHLVIARVWVNGFS